MPKYPRAPRVNYTLGRGKALVDCLHILAELKRAFKEDLNLDICLPKCKLYIKGLQLEEVREEVRKLLEANPALHGLKDILEIHEDPANNVVQVDGMVYVGVPIGSPAFVHAFVADKMWVSCYWPKSYLLEI